MKKQVEEKVQGQQADNDETIGLMGQFRDIVNVWGMDQVMNDPIVSINTRVCQALVNGKVTQAQRSLIDMATSEVSQHDLKVQTLWTVVYLFSLKSRGVKVVVQEPPLAFEQVLKRHKYNAISLSEAGMYWSKPVDNVIQKKQALVRIIPIQEGLHLELRRVSSFDGLTVRSTYVDSWECQQHMMNRKVDMGLIDQRLEAAGFKVPAIASSV